MELKTTRPRTCVKCKLHRKLSILRGHRNNCPFLHCGCSLCTAHERAKDAKGTCTTTSNVKDVDTSHVQPAFPELILSAVDLTDSTSRSQRKSIDQKREGTLNRTFVAIPTIDIPISVHFVINNFKYYAWPRAI